MMATYNLIGGAVWYERPTGGGGEYRSLQELVQARVKLGGSSVGDVGV